MVGIGGQRLVVPVFGVVIAAELAAGVADQRRHVGVVVVAHRAQRGDAAGIIALVVNQRIGLVPAAVEVLERAVVLRFLFLRFGLLLRRRAAAARRLVALRRRWAAAFDGFGKIRRADRGAQQQGGGKQGWSLHDLLRA